MRRFNPIAELRRFLPAQQGATAVEYGIIVGGIACAIMAALTALGGSMTQVLTTLTNAIH